MVDKVEVEVVLSVEVDVVFSVVVDVDRVVVEGEDDVELVVVEVVVVVVEGTSADSQLTVLAWAQTFKAGSKRVPGEQDRTKGSS